jgi:hypothetical protein
MATPVGAGHAASAVYCTKTLQYTLDETDRSSSRRKENRHGTSQLRETRLSVVQGTVGTVSSSNKWYDKLDGMQGLGGLWRDRQKEGEQGWNLAV